MEQRKNDILSTICYLIEHSHGTFELWVKRTEGEGAMTYEPVKVVQLSGSGTVPLRAEMIAEAILLEQWMADHSQVLHELRTSHD